MNKQTKQLYNQAWERWGFSEQSLIVAEEFSELIKELSKYNRDIGNEKNILQEVADCEIMIEQIKTKFNFSEKKITKIKKIKLEKLRKFLETENNSFKVFNIFPKRTGKIKKRPLFYLRKLERIIDEKTKRKQT